MVLIVLFKYKISGHFFFSIFKCTGCQQGSYLLIISSPQQNNTYICTVSLQSATFLQLHNTQTQSRWHLSALRHWMNIKTESYQFPSLQGSTACWSSREEWPILNSRNRLVIWKEARCICAKWEWAELGLHIFSNKAIVCILLGRW